MSSSQGSCADPSGTGWSRSRSTRRAIRNSPRACDEPGYEFTRARRGHRDHRQIRRLSCRAGRWWSPSAAQPPAFARLPTRSPTGRPWRRIRSGGARGSRRARPRRSRGNRVAFGSSRDRSALRRPRAVTIESNDAPTRGVLRDEVWNEVERTGRPHPRCRSSRGRGDCDPEVSREADADRGATSIAMAQPSGLCVAAVGVSTSTIPFRRSSRGHERESTPGATQRPDSPRAGGSAVASVQAT